MGIEGIIRPPPEIRAVADKTALFVAKNGRAFETRILNSAKGKTPKFAFLHETSPFHKYYEDRILTYQNGDDDDDNKKDKADDAKKVEENKGTDGTVTKESNEENDKKDGTVSDKTTPTSQAIVTTSARKAKSIIDPVARSLLLQRSKIIKEEESSNEKKKKQKDRNNEEEEEEENGDKTTPTNDEFIHQRTKLLYTTTIPPRHISPAQLEIIKLTAQFVALNGKSTTGKSSPSSSTFLQDLTLKEWKNQSTFGFLQPRHGDFAYFSSLVDVYRRLLAKFVHVEEEKKLNAKKDIANEDGGSSATDAKKESVLSATTVKKMVGLDSVIVNESDKNSQKTLLEDVIEEHDRMKYTAKSVSNCLDEVSYQVEYHRHEMEKRVEELEKLEGDNGGFGSGGGYIVDWHDFVVVETIEFPVDEKVEMLLPPPPPPPPPVPTEDKVDAVAGGKTTGEDTMDESSDEEEEQEKIEVVPDYTPKVVSSQAKFTSAARTHVIDPITQKSIPIEDMTEHMRIQLLDPKWAAEKQRFMEKQKESNFVQGDMIARNVDAFAKARGDLFGSSTEELLTQEEESKKRLEEANRVIREQSQMPQPRPNVQPTVPTASVQPQTTTEAIPHSKPNLAMPEPKRMRTEPLVPPMNQPIIPDNTSTSLPPAPTTTLPPVPDGTVPVPPGGEEQPVDAAEAETTEKDTILSEAAFAKSLPSPEISLSIVVPNDASNSGWNFNGQTLSITVNVMTKIKMVKKQLQSELGGMPPNKMQLKSSIAGFLKDGLSLAFYNIGSTNSSLELIPKVRGRRK